MEVAVVTRKSYCIGLTVQEFVALEAKDERIQDAYVQACRRGSAPSKDALKYQTLMDRLMSLGAADVEYNGHFGPNVFFTLDTDDDTPALQTKIHRLVSTWIRGATKAEERPCP